MSDSIEHILGELKAGRMARDVALALLDRQAGLPGPASPGARAAELFTLREQWIPQPLADGASPGPVRRVACVVAPGFLATASAAFAGMAAHLEVRFILADALAQGLQAARSDGGVDALVYLGNPLQPVCADTVEGPLALLHAIRGAALRVPRLLLCATHADALSRCHAESWIGIERSLHVLDPDTQAAVVLADAGSAGIDAWQDVFPSLLGELCASRLRNACHVAGRRYVLQVRPGTESSAPPPAVEGRTFLITGGAGVLGLRFAEYLSRQSAGAIVLVGRSALDAQRAARIAALGSGGCQIVYRQVDVTDAVAMRDGVREARSLFGGIHGAIHAAGIEGQGVLFDHPLHRLRDVMRPKVEGTLVLDEALRECPELDFLCCFSSSAAVLGDFGSVDYAIANRFQMAYAEHFGDASSRRLLSIGWPFWAGGGMGGDSDPERTRLYLDSAAMQALPVDRGLATFDHMLREEGGFHLVLYGDAARLRERIAAKVEVPAPEPVHRAPSRSRSAAMRGFSTEQCIAWELTGHVGEVLALPRDAILPNRNLTEFGFDSMTLTRLARRVSAHYGIAVSPAVFFSHPTLQQLVAYLVAHHGELLRAFYAEPVPAADLRTAPRAMPAPAVVASASPGSAARDEPIAIVGMSGRFPQARDVDELWRILVEGRDVVTDIPDERFDWRAYFDAGSRDGVAAMTSKWLGAMPGIDEFDPLFFEISPRDAQAMDPRQRLLLQEAWHALEDAGYGDVQLARDRVGMFVGIEQGDYQLLPGVQGSLTGNHDGILAARLSYALDLHGPAMAINCSCASGLVAAHQACLSLRAQDCDAAIAAGVNLILTPHPYIGMSGAGMLSTQGRCFAFDKRANGMVPGEAVVAVVLKRLWDARAAGDPVHGVIAASGVNYDGKTQGITAPNGSAQAALIRQTHARAGVVPADIDYVVAHGTGTRLGDPVEVRALDDVFNLPGAVPGHCALTSTKSNLGHTFAASGLVSLVGLLLAMRHDTIPASLHCEEPSDYIDWSHSAFHVNRANTPWPRRPDRPRMGAVSAFGMSGTNAHMLVREGDEEPTPSAVQSPAFVLAVSAATEVALNQRLTALAEMLRADASIRDTHRLAALSHTLLHHRQHLTHRCAMVVEDGAQALALLDLAQTGTRSPGILRGKVTGDFVERHSLVKYAASVIDALPSQAQDVARYRDSLATMGDLYCQGYSPSWRALYGDRPPQRLRLPAYPFSRQRYWVDAEGTRDSGLAPSVGDIGPASAVATSASVGMQYVVPRWEPIDASMLAAEPAAAFACTSTRPLLVGGSDRAREAVRASYPDMVSCELRPGDDIATLVRKLGDAGSFDHVIWIAPPSGFSTDAELIGWQEHGVLSVFRLVKVLLARGYGERDLAWTVVTANALQVHERAAIDPTHAGVHGLVGSMAKEFPRWSIRLLDGDEDDFPASAWSLVPADARAHPWAWREGHWHRRHLVRVRPDETISSRAYPGKVYVVIGGAGYIGSAWTEHVIRHAQAKVIWLGRRPLDARIQGTIDRLAALGPAPEYITADASDPVSLERTRGEIERMYGRIDGLVLSTLLLDPRGMGDMDEAQVWAALRAKVDTSIRAIEVFGRETLGQVVFFSSMIAFIRTPLHSGYSAACAFSDAYAQLLRKRWANRRGPVVKIMNWGFWDRAENVELEGFAGMARMGIGLIGAAEGMQALDVLLDGPLDQMGIVKTEKPVLIEGMTTGGEITIQAGDDIPDMARIDDRVSRALAAQGEGMVRGSVT